MKVLVTLGTRPEVIKLAPAIAMLKDHVETLVCSTGQHREMLTNALETFSIKPDVEFDCMRPGQSLNKLSSRVLSKMDDFLERYRPDWVLVQGDTTTAFAAALASFHRGIAVAHVEAGLRTGDLSSPFPEEANRSLLTRIATSHFAPTKSARNALIKEGISKDKILVTGNTITDAVNLIRERWTQSLPDFPDMLKNVPKNASTVLVTCHRRENFGDTLAGICNALATLAHDYSGYHFIFPVHLNPNVREPVRQLLGGIENLHLIDPVDYSTNLLIISRCSLIISDSGGIQEEAPSFGVPVVVMRNHTERMEGVNAGFAALAGQSAAGIEQAAREWLDNPERRKLLQSRVNPYGDGFASKRILKHLTGEDCEPFHG